MGDQGGRVQLQLLSYDELFHPTKEDSAKTIQKFRGLRKQNTLKGETRAKNELLTVLKQQRVLVDDRAIHFVAEARGKGRADARNSVFKLAQRYKVLPDTENVTRIRQLFGPVREGDSGDEDWEPSFRRLPTSLKTSRAKKLMSDDARDILLKEINNIEDESTILADSVVTKEVVHEDPEYLIGQAVETKAAEEDVPPVHGEKQQEGDGNHGESDEDEEDDHFDAEDLQALNDMQKEFVSNNLIAWMKDIRKAYESGVKLVKVNALGYKFIRILTIKDMVLSIRQPHTQSKAKVERQVAITEIVNVRLGRDSKQFEALEKLVEEGKEPPDNNHLLECRRYTFEEELWKCETHIVPFESCIIIISITTVNHPFDRVMQLYDPFPLYSLLSG
eukprot:XP_028343819.1 uncharacterized protein LOC114485966 [Physeter catodon]